MGYYGGAAAQASDDDLTTIAGLTATTDNFIVAVASAWASRTVAQVKTTLSLSNVDNTSDATKNAASVTLTNKTLTSPVINTPTGIVKGDVGLGNVDNTSNVTERAATATLTNKTLTSPVINTPTGIVKGDVGLGNVDNTSNVTERAATATLTNKTLTSPVINTPTGIVKGDVGLGNVDNTSNATERAATATLTNKRVTERVTTETSSATPTINTDNSDGHSITALAAAVTSMTTNLSGTPTNFQRLTIRFKDNATGRAITWGASFEAKGVALPTTTVASKVLTVGFIYDTVSAKWGCIASASEA